MGFIGTLVIGFVVGLVARAVLPGTQRLGIVLTTVLGVAGAFVASWAGQRFGWYAPGQPAGFIAATVGSVALLLLVSLFKRSSN